MWSSRVRGVQAATANFDECISDGRGIAFVLRGGKPNCTSIQLGVDRDAMNERRADPSKSQV